MKTLCVSTVAATREFLSDAVRSFHADAEIHFADGEENALYEADTRALDAVLLPVREKHFDGLALARRLYEISPETKVILVADGEKDAYPAFRTRARGYLVRADKRAIAEELTDLAVGKPTAAVRLEARTFGNFEFLSDGKPVRFGRSKSKELLAYLIYRRGTGVSASELIVNLWEEKDVDRTTRSMLHNLLSDLRKSLADAGADAAFSYERNCYRVNPECIRCDYFDYLDGKEEAKDLFIGEFLSGYEWAMYPCGELESIRQKREREAMRR